MGQIFLTVSTLTLFIAFVWALRWHFYFVPMQRGMKAISVLSFVTVSAAVYSILADKAAEWPLFIVAVVLQTAAAGLFSWSVVATRTLRLALAFSPQVPSALVTVGPYRFVAHPFYVSYTIFWISLVAATKSWVCAAGFVALTILYILAAYREESSIRSSSLGSEYSTYKKSRHKRISDGHLLW